MSKNPNSPSTGHASNPSAIPAPMQPPRSLPKQNKYGAVSPAGFKRFR